MAKVSFVIPAKNAEAWIAETLESVIEQTYKDWECIVVDDHSTDDTAEVVRFYIKMDERIKLVENRAGKGRSAARNYGNRVASGDIIMVLDSDDIAQPNRAEETVKFFDDNKDKDVFYSSFGLMGPLGDSGGSEVARETSLDRARETLMFGIGHSTMAYRRSVVDIGYDQGEYSELGIDDWKLQCDALKAGLKFGFSDKSLAIYRIIPKPRDEKRIEELKRECLS